MQIFGGLKVLLAIVVAHGLMTVPAQAMNWCALPQITPERESDFEKLAPTVAALTGCERQPTDSAHRALWICEDDPLTPEINERVHIHYLREPGQNLNLAILAADITSFDMLRACGLRDVRNETGFSAGNVLLRDRVRLGIVGPTLSLTSLYGASTTAIISDTKSYGSSPYLEGLWSGIYGITVENDPSTSVKLAGLSPISSDVYAIASAFEARGSTLLSSEKLGETFPNWRLTPPVGLGGVKEVVLQGWAKHLIRAEYLLESTPDYERFIELLDAEYGRSERLSEDGCTYRWWESGRVSIRGEHCPGVSDTISFFNDVSSDQLEQYAAKLEAEQKAAAETEDEPAIDSDMF